MTFLVRVEFVTEHSENLEDAIEEVREFIRQGNSQYPEDYSTAIISASVCSREEAGLGPNKE